MVKATVEGRNDKEAERNKDDVVTIKKEFYEDLMASGFLSSKFMFVDTIINRETW